VTCVKDLNWRFRARSGLSVHVSLVIHSRTYYDGAKPGEGGAAGNGADRQSIDGEVAAIDGPLTPRGMTVGGLVLTVILRFERKLCAVMFRIVAVALAAMAAFDWY
jgi:hypothetical protein